MSLSIDFSFILSFWKLCSRLRSLFPVFCFKLLWYFSIALVLQQSFFLIFFLIIGVIVMDNIILQCPYPLPAKKTTRKPHVTTSIVVSSKAGKNLLKYYSYKKHISLWFFIYPLLGSPITIFGLFLGDSFTNLMLITAFYCIKG